MNQYESVYKNTGTVPRTMKSHSDAYAIERGRSEWQDAKEFFVGAFLVMAILALGVGIALEVLSWFGVVLIK